MVKVYQTESIRNIGFFGHRGSGKTSLAEAFLFDGGATNRLGSVDNNTSVFDYREEEQSRKFTISAKPGWIEWAEHKINFIDTPGDLSFLGDSHNMMGIIDLAVFVVSNPAGVEVGTEILWERAEKLGVPRLIFVNKFDRARGDQSNIIDELTSTFEGAPIIPLQIPIGQGDKFEGVVDLLTRKAYRYKGDGSANFEEIDVPSELQDRLEEARQELLYKIAETDERLEEILLETEDLPDEEALAGLKKAVKGGNIFPVLYGSATSNIAIPQLLDFICNYGPNPLERKPFPAFNEEGKEIEVQPEKDGPATAVVFQTVLSRVGKYSIFRVVTGTVESNREYLNPNTKTTERMGSLIFFQGKEQQTGERAVAGEIVGVAKLKNTRTGDTLCDPERKLTFNVIHPPQPVIAYAIKCDDEDKVFQGFSRLAEEDIGLILERDPQTNELLIKGQGQSHIDVAVERLRNQFKQKVELVTPKVAYRETIRGSVKNVEGKLKKQTGGRGQFAICYIDMSPSDNEDGFDFEDAIVGGVIPKQFIPAVHKGIEEAAKTGPLAGYPTVGFHVRLFDGKTHPVDSSEQAFKMAGIFAFRNAVEKCKPVLLEPIMTLEVTVPNEYQGDISGDLNRRRGRIEETIYRGKNVTIRAKVPQAEILTYANQLTSMTEGRGTFRVEFSHYEQVPPPIQKQVIEQAKAERGEG